MFIHWFFVEMLKKETKKTSGEIKRGKNFIEKTNKIQFKKIECALQNSKKFVKRIRLKILIFVLLDNIFLKENTKKL